MTRPSPGSSRRRLAAVLWVAVLALGACGGGGGSAAPGSSDTPAASGGASSSSGQPSGSPSLPPGTFVNPVIADDFPDPFVLRAGDVYYAYATTDGAQHIQLAKSTDLVTWEELNDPLPKLPLWSTGDTWAPEVAKTSAGYVLYYTAHDSDIKRPDMAGSQCITLAVSESPEGPFVDRSDKPLVCQGPQGGSIDGTPFVDADGRRYLIWKNDGNCCGLPTRFFIQELSADGLKLVGKASDMGLVNDEPWEGALIEAPTLLLRDGTYYLFYSANGYDSEFYAIGYATSTSLHGPYKDAPENPILSSAWGRDPTSEARGPGHQSLVEDDDGELWIVYHAWDKDAVGYSNGGQRAVWIDKLLFKNGKPVVDGPNDDPEPIP